MNVYSARVVGIVTRDIGKDCVGFVGEVVTRQPQRRLSGSYVEEHTAFCGCGRSGKVTGKKQQDSVNDNLAGRGRENNDDYRPSYCGISAGNRVAKAAFDANTYVELLKAVVNYTKVKDCWLCGTADQLDSAVLGIPLSNWMDLDPYSLHNSSKICRQGDVTTEETNFVLTLVNESVALINYSTGGKNLGSFHKSSGNWSTIKLKLQHNFDVLRPDKYSEGVGTQQWADYLFGRATTNYALAINASCNLPDGFW